MGVRLVMVVAAGAALFAAPALAQGVTGDPEAGADLYSAECRGCHSVSIGPTLRGLIGRPAASVAGFGGYSDALKAKAGLIWTEANIDAFLTGPQVFAPGTLMTKAISDPQQRADIIAYIATLPPPRQ
jgi:cytochrome c